VNETKSIPIDLFTLGIKFGRFLYHSFSSTTLFNIDNLQYSRYFYPNQED